MNYKGRDRTVYNEKREEVVGMMRVLRDDDPSELVGWMLAKSEKLGMTNDASFVGSGIVPPGNAKGLLMLKEEYSSSKNARLLLMMSMYAFNGKLRFNAAGEFTNSAGDSSITGAKVMDVAEAHGALQGVDIVCGDALSFPFESLPRGSFVYMDPPYELSEFTLYGRKFSSGSQRMLPRLEGIADMLDGMGVFFGISEMLRSKGQKNEGIVEWASRRGYAMHELPCKHSVFRWGSEEDAADVECYITNVPPPLWE